MHAVELAAGHLEVARHARAGREHDRVVGGEQLLGGDVGADVHPAAQLDALGAKLLHAPLDDRLLDLEVRHPEAHEASDRLVALEQRDGVAGAPQLLGGGHPGRARADHGDRAAALPPWRLGLDPALLPGPVDDRVLDLFDRDGVALPDLEHAGGLARGGAQPPGELREVVRGVQLPDRVRRTGRGRRGRSSRGSGCRADSRCGRRARRSPCSARPAREARARAAGAGTRCSRGRVRRCRGRAPRAARSSGTRRAGPSGSRPRWPVRGCERSECLPVRPRPASVRSRLSPRARRRCRRRGPLPRPVRAARACSRGASP